MCLGLLFLAAASAWGWALLAAPEAAGPSLSLRLLPPLPPLGADLSYEARPSGLPPEARLKLGVTFEGGNVRRFELANDQPTVFSAPLQTLQRQGAGATVSLAVDGVASGVELPRELTLPMFTDLNAMLYPGRSAPPDRYILSMASSPDDAHLLVLGTKGGVTLLYRADAPLVGPTSPLRDRATTLRHLGLDGEFARGVAELAGTVWVQTPRSLCRMATSLTYAKPLCQPFLAGEAPLAPSPAAEGRCVWTVDAEGTLVAADAESGPAAPATLREGTDPLLRGLRAVRWLAPPPPAEGQRAGRHHLLLLAPGRAYTTQIRDGAADTACDPSLLDPPTPLADVVLEDALPDPTDPGRLWGWAGREIRCLDRRDGGSPCFVGPDGGAAKVEVPAPQEVTALLPTAEGLWVGTTQGLYHHPRVGAGGGAFAASPSVTGPSPAGSTATDGVAGGAAGLRAVRGGVRGGFGRVTALHLGPGPDGPVPWVGTLDGLFRCEGGPDGCVLVTEGRLSLSSGRITAAARRDGPGVDLWLGDEGGGVHHVWNDREGGLQHYGWAPAYGEDEHASANGYRPIRVIAPEPGTSNVWVAGMGIWRLTWEGNQIRRTQIARFWDDTAAPSAGGRQVNALVWMGRRMWAATEQGLFVAEGDAAGVVFAPPRSAPSWRLLRAMVGDGRGRLWIALADRIVCYAPERLGPCEGVADVTVTASALWADEARGHLWYGTATGEVGVLTLGSGEAPAPPPTEAPNAPREEIRAVWRDPDGHLWVLGRRSGGGTGEALARVYWWTGTRWEIPADGRHGLQDAADRGGWSLFAIGSPRPEAGDLGSGRSLVWAGAAVTPYHPVDAQCPASVVQALAWRTLVGLLTLGVVWFLVLWRMGALNRLHDAVGDFGKAFGGLAAVTAFLGWVGWGDLWADLPWLPPALSVLVVALTGIRAWWREGRPRWWRLGAMVFGVGFTALVVVQVRTGLRGDAWVADLGACLSYVPADTSLAPWLRAVAGSLAVPVVVLAGLFLKGPDKEVAPVPAVEGAPAPPPSGVPRGEGPPR